MRRNSRAFRPRRAGLLPVVLAVLVLTGCASAPGLDDVPLPGSGVDGDAISLVADFDEALNLAGGALVKVDGVDAGRVQDVEVVDFRARVTMDVLETAEVREGATARLRYTTPLGELFVEVTNPDDGPLLGDGDELSPGRTTTAPTVEDTLASASLLVNGGGLDQLAVVTRELNAALGGREGTVRSVLRRTNGLLDEADRLTGDLDRALRELAGVAEVLDARRSTVDAALRDVRPAARVLREETDDVTRLLRTLERFSGRADATVRQVRDDLLLTVRELGPVLGELAASDDEFARSLDALVELGDLADTLVPGDYLNLGLHLTLDGTTFPGTDQPVPDLPDLPPLPGLPGLPTLPGPGLPDLPGLPDFLPDLPLGGAR